MWSPRGVLDKLQLDLLTAIARIEQLRDADFPEVPDPLSICLWERVLSCDLPRLRSHLTAAALEFEAESDADYGVQRQSSDE